MKLRILYRPHSEFARPVEEFAQQLESRHHLSSELIDIDTRAGSELARTYDITRYPAIMVTRENGDLVQHWMGEQLPLIDEVLAFLR